MLQLDSHGRVGLTESVAVPGCFQAGSVVDSSTASPFSLFPPPFRLVRLRTLQLIAFLYLFRPLKR
jgi:hypothetical protein